MVKAQDLVVKGTASQYLVERPTIYCYKKEEGKGAIIPCRYNKRKREYESVKFPQPSLPLRPEQEKVLQEMRAICDRQKADAKQLYLEKGEGSLVEEDSIDAKKGDGFVACHTIFGHIYTGFGKSPTGSIFAAQQEGPILIFCDRDAVRRGWVGTWKQFFDIEPYCATGDILGKHNVCICSIQLAVLHAEKFKDDFKHYKVVICDEADTLCTQKAVNVLLELAPKYLLGITATVRRNDGLDKVLDVFWGARKDWIQRLKEFGESCSMVLNILHTPFHVESIYNRKSSLDWMGMAQMVSAIHERNIMIRNLCISHMNAKILILTKTKDHVEVISSLLRDVCIDTSTYYDKDKTYYDAHVLVATLSKAGRGYDDKQVSAAFDGRRFDVLILCMTMKDADQALGRALRGESLIVYLLVDDNPTMKNHAEEMKRVNSKRGATINEEYM